MSNVHILLHLKYLVLAWQIFIYTKVQVNWHTGPVAALQVDEVIFIVYYTWSSSFREGWVDVFVPSRSVGCFAFNITPHGGKNILKIC